MKVRRILGRGLATTKRQFRRLGVVRHSPYENIFHCCTQRTASQWFRAVLSDPAVYRYSGLEGYLFTKWRKQLLARDFETTLPLLDVSALLYSGHRVSVPLPRRTIGLDLYIGYETYALIPKPTDYRTFFILRDPRDIIVSWYFSTKYSHKPSTTFLIQFRNDLENLDFSGGIRYSIDRIKEFGLFEGQRSWIENLGEDEHSQVFRYEDFAQDNHGFLRKLFVYLDIRMPQNELDALYQRHTFESYSAGRDQGAEDKRSHYRKGTPGDWQNHFDDSLHSYFRQVTGDLLDVLGYS